METGEVGAASTKLFAQPGGCQRRVEAFHATWVDEVHESTSPVQGRVRQREDRW